MPDDLRGEQKLLDHGFPNGLENAERSDSDGPRPALSGNVLPVEGDVFVDFVNQLYLAILQREADTPALSIYSDALRHGELTLGDLTRELLASKEFEAIGLNHYRVSRIAAWYTLRALTGSEPDDEAVEITSQRLKQNR